MHAGRLKPERTCARRGAMRLCVLQWKLVKSIGDEALKAAISTIRRRRSGILVGRAPRRSAALIEFSFKL